MAKQTKKKVLKFSNSEFLYQLFPDRITTTGHIKNALDLNELDWDTFVNVMNNLHKQGYKVEVVEVG